MGGHGSARNSPLIKAIASMRVTRYRKANKSIDVRKFSHGRPRHRNSRPNGRPHGCRTRQGPRGGLSRHNKNLGAAAWAARLKTVLSSKAFVPVKTASAPIPPPPARVPTAPPRINAIPPRALSCLLVFPPSPIIAVSYAFSPRLAR